MFRWINTKLNSTIQIKTQLSEGEYIFIDESNLEIYAHVYPISFKHYARLHSAGTLWSCNIFLTIQNTEMGLRRQPMQDYIVERF